MELIGGVILAGGQSTRMGGGDKCLKMLGGKTLISRIIERVSPQISTLILNANGNPSRFLDFFGQIFFRENSAAGYASECSGFGSLMF